ncbi:MAG: MerR family transcriptional regulator [Endomicrobium sp.]|jgi:DNA-binding transcriptional MerR regulator|nr:MerR family transcriptional regulator [Endomicrobium sp.]
MQQYYTISEIAKKMGLTTYTLRYYDKEGLLPFIDRSEAGIRKFKNEDLEWLAVINCLKETGMSVKEIRQFIKWCLDGEKTFKKRLNLFLEQKKKVKEQMEILNKHMEKIDYKIWYYETAISKGIEAAQKENKCCKDIKIGWVKDKKNKSNSKKMYNCMK